MARAQQAKPGLRERKKRDTLNAIELAAVTLALELGPEQVTVAGICARAGVSRSTFFNYMPTREAAIFGRPLPAVDADAAIARLESSGDASVAHALVGVIVEVLGGGHVNAEVARMRFALVSRHPETQVLVRDPILRMFDELLPVVVRWLDAHPERRVSIGPVDREAAMIVGVAGLALQDMLTEFIRGEGESGDRQITAEGWAESIAMLRGIVAPE